MDDVSTHLAGLNADSAKRRERAIKNLTPTAMQEPSIVDALQKIVSSDPVEYVREAARAQLVAARQTPAESTAPIQLKQEGVRQPAAFAISCVAIPVILVCVVLLMIVALALLGPQIGNIFSRVTSGLGGTP